MLPGQCGKEGCICHHQYGLVECAYEVFAPGMVYGHLSPDGGIRLGQQRGGTVYEWHAPPVRGCGKPSRVPYGAAAKGYHRVRAAYQVVHKAGIYVEKPVAALYLLAGGQYDAAGSDLCPLQRGHDGIEVQLCHSLVRHHRRPAEAGEQALFLYHAGTYLYAVFPVVCVYGNSHINLLQGHLMP